jgi:hypothetical protein
VRAPGIALLIAFVLGCGGSSARETEAPDPGGRTGEGEAEPTANANPLTEVECAAFFRHVIAVELEQMKRDKPAELIPTDEQVAAIHDTMMQEGLESCRAEPRANLDCAMAATTRAAIESCLGDGS